MVEGFQAFPFEGEGGPLAVDEVDVATTTHLNQKRHRSTPAPLYKGETTIPNRMKFCHLSAHCARRRV